jgi:hypothetical protein
MPNLSARRVAAFSTLLLIACSSEREYPSSDGLGGAGGTPSGTGAKAGVGGSGEDGGAGGDTNSPALALVGSARSAIVGTDYSFSFEVEGSDEPSAWSIESGELPPGIQLTSDGKLEGKPTETGFFTFEIKVEGNGGAVATRAFELSVRGSRWAAFRSDHALQGQNLLYLVDYTDPNAEPILLTKATSASVNVTRMSFSPDGKWLAYSGKFSRSDKDDLYVVDVSGAAPKEPILLNKADDVFFVSWSPKGTYMAYSAKAGADTVIRGLDFSTGQPVSLPSSIGTNVTPLPATITWLSESTLVFQSPPGLTAPTRTNFFRSYASASGLGAQTDLGFGGDVVQYIGDQIHVSQYPGDGGAGKPCSATAQYLWGHVGNKTFTAREFLSVSPGMQYWAKYDDDAATYDFYKLGAFSTKLFSLSLGGCYWPYWSGNGERLVGGAGKLQFVDVTDETTQTIAGAYANASSVRLTHEGNQGLFDAVAEGATKRELFAFSVTDGTPSEAVRISLPLPDPTKDALSMGEISPDEKSAYYTGPQTMSGVRDLGIVSIPPKATDPRIVQFEEQGQVNGWGRNWSPDGLTLVVTVQTALTQPYLERPWLYEPHSDAKRSLFEGECQTTCGYKEVQFQPTK